MPSCRVTDEPFPEGGSWLVGGILLFRAASPSSPPPHHLPASSPPSPTRLKASGWNEREENVLFPQVVPGSPFLSHTRPCAGVLVARRGNGPCRPPWAAWPRPPLCCLSFPKRGWRKDRQTPGSLMPTEKPHVDGPQGPEWPLRGVCVDVVRAATQPDYCPVLDCCADLY